MTIVSLAWRSLRTRPVRALLSAAGVALGVSVLVAGMATNEGIEASVERAVNDAVGRAALRVEAFGETGLSTATIEAIAGTDGVETVAPAVEARRYLAVDVATGEDFRPPVTLLGIDTVAEPKLHDLTLAQGQYFSDERPKGALVTAQLASQDHLALGDPIVVQGAGERVVYEVVGIVAGSSVSDPYGRTVIVPLASAMQVLGVDGVTRVDIGLAAGSDGRAVGDALESAIVDQPYVLSAPADLGATLRRSTADFQATTALIAAIALFSGAFLIFNTLSMTVAERIREVGLLRSAGATRRQVQAFMLTQAMILGVAGSLAGLGVGIALAMLMTAWIGSVGEVVVGGPALTPQILLIAFGVGVVVTLAAAIEPARRASRIRPVEALRARLDLPDARKARLRWLVLVFAYVAMFGLLFWPRGVNGVGAFQALMVYAILLVATLLIPVVLPLISRVAGIPFAFLARIEERIARASVIRDRSRTTLTLGALTVGLAMIVALGGVGQQARAAAGSWIEEVIPGDVVLTSIRPVGPEEGVAADLTTTVPGLALVSPIATFDLALEGVRTDAAAVVGSDLAADGRLVFTAGDREQAFAALDAGGAAILPADLAERRGIHYGDVLPVPTVDGSPYVLRVVGLVARSIPGSGGDAMLVGWPDATGKFGVLGADVFAVQFAPDAQPGVEAALDTQATAWAFEMVPVERIEGAIDDALARMFSLFDALALVAVIVAALGIVNTLTMNVIERVREIGILRASGMTRRQVWRSVVVEAGILGLAGALMGIIVGLAIGFLMVTMAGGDADLVAGIPWSIVGAALALGVVIAMLAAAYPARIAARLSIIRAVQYE